MSNQDDASAPAADGESRKVRTLLDAVIEEFRQFSFGNFYSKKLDAVPTGKALLAQDRETQAEIVPAVLGRLAAVEPRIAALRAKAMSAYDTTTVYASAEWRTLSVTHHALVEVLRGLLRRDLPLGEEEVVRLVGWAAGSFGGVLYAGHPLSGVAAAAESFAALNAFGPRARGALESAIRDLRDESAHGVSKECRKVADRLAALVAGGPQARIEPGEAWSDAALADLKKLKPPTLTAWNELLGHCQTGGAGKFTPKWETRARSLIEAVGFESFRDHVVCWFPLVDKPRTVPIDTDLMWIPGIDLAIPRGDRDQDILSYHVELLRGLVWCCGLQEDADLARAVTRLAISAYRKVPGKGPRLVALGNACITALGRMSGLTPIGQLAVLKVKVKFGTAQKEIEKAFNAAAARENLPREEIEELAVPSYGLEDVGKRSETFGDYRADLVVDGSSATIQWFKDGKPLKSTPAAAKKDHAEEVKELQSALKDLNTMLPVQRERLDAMFLARKSWPIGVWRERYLDHALVGTIARRLVWSFATNGQTADGIWHDGKFVAADGRELPNSKETTVSLWHPIGRPVEAVLAWRTWLEGHRVVQPFKQAHREVYVLTDAERGTNIYSNRFAAHILRQHQFHALCASRGWKDRLRLMVDGSDGPASRELPQWDLRAEFWVEGAGDDLNQSGVHQYLSTDQVRFYRGADELVSLAEVPALVFSEVMRDVDLFVGVASVGNDPTWFDGGPGGQYGEYWRSYSFGELSETAQTRKALLERLIPRLKIADRCSFADRFLVVRGDLRTYKIHLGSGNILMEPNDRYLCIVPKQTAAAADGVFLPFEGDGTLSVILSKAFLLAADAGITDPTIVSQLKT